MSRFLFIDVGAGTMDILYYDDSDLLSYKAVVKSPVRHLAEKAAAIPGNLVVTGVEMGGGAISNVLQQRAQNHKVVMSISSSATIHHNTDRVRASGIQIVEDDAAEKLKKDPEYSHFLLGDLELNRLKQIVDAFGVPFDFDVVGVCAQDHGVPPTGVSHLDFRHNTFRKVLDKTPFPHAMLYEGEDVPPTMNRLSSIASIARKIPSKEIYVMDSGMAAIAGAAMDPSARSKKNILVMDVATSHTLGAALIGDEIAGFFEYHTKDITRERMERLMVDLAEGRLNHDQILKEGGHGACIRKTFGFDSTEAIIATGPKRKMLAGSSLPIRFGAPFGDNMMTGALGLLESIRRAKGLEPGSYL